MSIVFSVTRDGFEELEQFMTDNYNELIIKKIVDPRYDSYIIVINNEIIPKKLQYVGVNFMILNDHNYFYPNDKICLNLIIDKPDTVLEIKIETDDYYDTYNINTEDWYAEFQNILKFCDGSSDDIISVKNNKLFFCSKNLDFQPHNKDLLVINTWYSYIDKYVEWEERLGLTDDDSIRLLHLDSRYNKIDEDYSIKERYKGKSMRRIFNKIDFDLIEYATIKINEIITDNYYYSLKWIGNMRNLKRLNLILELEDENSDIQQLISNMNLPVGLQNLIIRTECIIDETKLKIPFGTMVEIL